MNPLEDALGEDLADGTLAASTVQFAFADCQSRAPPCTMRDTFPACTLALLQEGIPCDRAALPLCTEGEERPCISLQKTAMPAPCVFTARGQRDSECLLRPEQLPSCDTMRGDALRALASREACVMVPKAPRRPGSTGGLFPSYRELEALPCDH